MPLMAPGILIQKVISGTMFMRITPNPISSPQITNAIIAPDDQQITYTSFNKVSTITQAQQTVNYSFVYGADEQRRSMTHTENGSTVATYYYFGRNEVEGKRRYHQAV